MPRSDTGLKARTVRKLERLVRRVAIFIGDDENYSRYPQSSLTDRRFANIGAGNFFHKYWTNVDYKTDWYAEAQTAAFVNYNLNDMAPLPFADNSLEVAYTSHTIEHVKNDAVRNLFLEVFRCLKPGGIFRITCPDADRLFLATSLNRSDYWVWRHNWFRKRGVNPDEVAIEDYLVRELCTSRSPWVGEQFRESTLDFRTVREKMNTSSREEFFDWLTAPCRFRDDAPGHHINWWTHDKCARFLSEAPYTSVYRSDRGASLALPLQNPNHFDTTFPVMSLYIEAIK